MKIMIVTEGYFPGEKYGGPPVSIKNFCNLLLDTVCYIITKNHDMGENKKYENIQDGWNSQNNVSVLYLSDKEYNMKSFEKNILQIKPDLIYLQSLFQRCVIPCLKLAKKYKIKVLLAPRGELCKGAFKKKYKKIPYILYLKLKGLIKNIDIQSTSEEETKMEIKYLGLPKEKIHYLTNIPTISNIKREKTEKKVGEIKLIFISRIVPKKNLIYAIKCLKELKGKVKFDIYGSKEDLKYWEECEKEIEKLPNNIKVKYCGNLAHDDVCHTFSIYDAFLFPSLSENFGHVIAESLSVGTPVIVSDQTPWKNLKKYNAGCDINLEKKSDFIKEIQYIIDLDNNSYNKLRKDSRKFFYLFFKLEELQKEYISCIERIIEN